MTYRPELRLDRPDLGARYLKQRPEMLEALYRYMEVGARTWPQLQLQRAHLLKAAGADVAAPAADAAAPAVMAAAPAAAISNSKLPAAAVEFLQKHYDRTLTKEYLDIFFDNPTALIHIWTRDSEIVAVIGGITATVAICGRSAPRLVANYLCVAPELRGQGLVRYVAAAISIDAYERSESVLSIYHTSESLLTGGFSTTTSFIYPLQLEALRRKNAWAGGRPPGVPAGGAATRAPPDWGAANAAQWVRIYKAFHERNGYAAYYDWTIEEATRWLASPAVTHLTFDEESDICFVMLTVRNVRIAVIFCCCFADAATAENTLASAMHWLRKNSDAEMAMLQIRLPTRLTSWTEVAQNPLNHFLVNQLVHGVAPELNALTML